MGSSAKLDSVIVSRLVSPFVDQATCLDCCKLYIAPETARCGHTFCHACWRKRRSCMCCEAPLDRRTLKLNVPVQNITEHVQSMCEIFEKIFDFKVEKFSLGDGLSTELEFEPDPAKNVNDWLASSQNHFSAPISSDLTQDITNVEHNISTSTVQVHSHIKKVTTPRKVVHKPPAQEDWEKIEHLPDTDEQITKQTKVVDNSQEYSTEHPRRSSRKRELKRDDNPKMLDAAKEKCSSKESSIEIDTKTTKNKQKWNNVKKMRKEFSKLNKQNRNKLNVSIEMCKKAKANNGKANNTGDYPISEKIFVIEDDTPIENIEKIVDKTNKDQQIVKSTNNFVCDNNVSKNNSKESQINSSKRNSSNIQNENLVTSKRHSNNIQYLEQNDKNKSNVSDKNEKSSKMPFYKKGNLHIDTDKVVKNNVQTVNYNIDCSNSSNADDIEITIKIGDTVANIFFKRKKNEPPKVNINQEIQTSIGIHTLDEVAHSNEEYLQNYQDNKEKEQTVAVVEDKESFPVQLDVIHKSESIKKNTASAETVTAQFEITESVEKELSSVMEIAEQQECNDQHSEIIRTKSTKSTNKISISTHSKQIAIENPKLVENLDGSDFLNDMDIFQSGSVREGNVHVLKDTNNTHSEIIPTMKSTKGKTQNMPKKRKREAVEDIEKTNKKQKFTQNSPKAKNTVELDKSLQKEFAMDSEAITYDAIMGQVFANIDADIHNTQKRKALIKDTQVEESQSNINKKDQQRTVVLTPDKMAEDPINIEDSVCDNVVAPEGCSENVFSVMEKENESNEIIEDNDENPKSVQQEVENLTPEVFMGTNKLCTPHQNVEDDDKSVVEETPQKTVSFTKPKNKSENVQHLSLIKRKSMTESQAQSIVDVSDSKTSSNVSKEVTIIDIARKQTETPLTINRFVDQIKHKSTPVARKSLNFEDDNDDPEQTLCPTTDPVKTTQEKEFMSKAFENTPKSPVRKPLMIRNVIVDVKTYCLAGSCLSSVELAKVKVLCRQNNWKFVDKYTDELTHLVVGVDEENRSQRSVKYMCALAASKWIVSFRWIDVCLNTSKIVNEEYFEALDGTGEPGPKRSRIAKKKLFEGITFFCMPPFSILDVDTLKRMLEAAGGTVVKEMSSVRASGEAPALLLAEPESTQENKFLYMAVELSVVPVNYEWALNCLGSYSLYSVHELLLCPPTLLPAATARWPHQLLSQED